MNNINIIKCKYGGKCLINVEYDSKLELSNGFIENNSGNQSIIHVDIDGTLNLEGFIFRKNIQRKRDIPSCIHGENGSNVNISNCEFLNHSSKEYPYSALLIKTGGDLNIKSSKFDNNNAEIRFFRSIEVKIIIFFNLNNE